MKKPPTTPPSVILHSADGTRKRWRLVWLPKGHALLDGAPGRVEAPWKKGKRIFLEIGQKPSDLFDTIVHEAAHAAGWNLAEDWVFTFAEDITRIMAALGYEFKKVR